MIHSHLGCSCRTDAPVVQSDSLCCVLCRSTVSSMPLSIFWGNTLRLWRLVSRFLRVQRIFGEQDADSRDSPLHAHGCCSRLWTLPHFTHCPVVELGHLMESSHPSFEDLHTGNGLGYSSSWAGEDHLSQRRPSAALSLSLNASCCKPQQIADLASFFHSHVQHVCSQARDGVGTAVLTAADSPEVASAKFLRQRGCCGVRVEWNRLLLLSSVGTVWTLHLTPGLSHHWDGRQDERRSSDSIRSRVYILWLWKHNFLSISYVKLKTDRLCNPNLSLIVSIFSAFPFRLPSPEIAASSVKRVFLPVIPWTWRKRCPCSVRHWGQLMPTNTYEAQRETCRVGHSALKGTRNISSCVAQCSLLGLDGGFCWTLEGSGVYLSMWLLELNGWINSS